MPNKKIVFVQNHDVHKKVPIDSIVRTYHVEPYNYRVQPQDVLWIRFESLTEKDFDFLNQGTAQPLLGGNTLSLTGELVDETGCVTYPVLGKVKVEGLTVFEVQEKLQGLADQYLESPKVSVRMTNFRFTVLGEVNGEKQILLFNNRVNILEAIGLAGGMGELADRSKVKLIRQNGTQVDIQYLNLLDENLITSPYYYIHQNDIIVVPPLKQRNFRRNFGPNLALVVSSLSLGLLAFNLITK